MPHSDPVHSSRIASRARLLGAALALVVIPASLHAQEPVRPLQQLSASAVGIRDSLVSFARAQLGRRYVHGGQSPERGFDCSGLVKYVMAAFHLDLPRTARQQAKAGLALGRDTSALRPGDLLTFGRSKEGVSHIGIYVGDGRFIHASSVAGRVIESPVNRPPSRLVKAWKGARRLLVPDDSVRGTVVSVDGPSTSG